MFVFNESSTRRSTTPWGKEVKKRLIDLDMSQQALINALKEKGYDIHKAVFSQLLCGYGVSTKEDVIREINGILGIPFETKT